MPAERTVYVIDDDDAVRDSICMLLEGHGIAARPYASAAAFLADPAPKQGCLLVDVDMPGMNGLELLARLRASMMALPVIVMTGTSTSRTQLAVDRAEATLLRKPFRTGELIASIATALDRCRS
jgi:FixJ family two-component response regulator